MKTNTLIFLSFLSLISCKLEETYKFNIRNNSDKNVYSYEGTPNLGNVYPDTIIRTSPPTLLISANTTIYKGGFSPQEKIWEDLSIDTMSIYFFDAETVDNIPWETIREEYKVLKRYDLSLEDIQFLDYEISYPPTEQMKDMRMYPPYEE